MALGWKLVFDAGDPHRQAAFWAQALDLPLAGIDLRLRPDGAYLCFAVNPMPAHRYYESNTGLPISLALAHFLAASA